MSQMVRLELLWKTSSSRFIYEMFSRAVEQNYFSESRGRSESLSRIVRLCFWWHFTAT